MSTHEAAIHIRAARPEDAETIANFNCQMATESEGAHLNPAIALKGVRQGLDHPELCRYFVAEIDGRIIGQTMVTLEWSDWRAGMFWWIQSVYVHPDARRRGVFSAIHAHIESLARADQNACGLRLYVEKDNHRAKATYERLGMRLSGHVLYERDWSGAIG